jgi:hypothetical protein
MGVGSPWRQGTQRKIIDLKVLLYADLNDRCFLECVI